VKLSPLRAFKRANNRDFRFYATINRVLLVPSREFTPAVTYKLAGIVLLFRVVRAPRTQAYYNVTVTFYVARNSDTASRLWGHQHRFSSRLLHAFGQTSIIASLPPTRLRLARLCDFSLETPVPFVPYDWKRLWHTRDLCESLETLCG